jgi:type II secretory pathway pseudopilin PulG
MSSVAVLIIVLVVAAIIIAALVIYSVSRQRRGRQERAREEYGSEYERAVEEHGSEREAEKDLRERRERMEGEIQPLSEESRRRYDEQWRRVEQTFVDDPAASLDDADRVVAEILTERNFPVDSRQEASKGIGVMHPGVVEDFREAQRIRQDAVSSRGEADLERMRQAIQKYRSVYERLTEE